MSKYMSIKVELPVNIITNGTKKALQEIRQNELRKPKEKQTGEVLKFI